MPTNTALLPLLKEISRDLDGSLSLDKLATRSGWSRYHFHRAFQKLSGETPKQYILRLRLERAAGMLLAGKQSMLEIALANGFGSHEVFIRAFRRRWGCTPTHYRKRVAAMPQQVKMRHQALTRAIGPCINLYHLPLQPAPRSSTMATLSITREKREPQPILFIQRRLSRNQLQASMGECFGKIFMHCQAKGLAMAGFPLARYVATGPGLWTVDFALPLVEPASAEGEMQSGFLHGGYVALGIHGGPYDLLPETNAAIERWIEANGYRVGGPHWEWYVTDPGEHPDPKDWRTEVYWPLAE